MYAKNSRMVHNFFGFVFINMVEYPLHLEVNKGKELTPTQVKTQPNVTWWEGVAPNNTLYTLCMIDADSPSQGEPIYREFLHWLVVNTPRNEIAKGDTLAEYMPVFPSMLSGLHRYVFLLYQQPEKLTFNEPHLSNKSMVGRMNFNISEFAIKYNLSNPFAGNFFKAQYDDYVPELLKELN